MKIERFEDLFFWQKAKDVSILIYKIFKDNRDFSFKDQIQRAAISISNNSAEGFERRSNKEMKQFLYIAKGSCGEARSMLYIAQELNYVTPKEFEEIHSLLEEISKLISGFIKRL